MGRNVYLKELKELSYDYYGCEGNPIIWVKNDLECNENKCYAPSNVYINDDGEIVIEVPVDYLSR